MGEARRKRLLDLMDDSGHTCDTDAQSLVRSFAQAKEHGWINRFTKQARGGFEVVATGAETYHWAKLPVFDFGHLQDPTSPDFLGQSFTGSITDECFKLANSLLNSGEFHLPFSECIYIIRYYETSHGFETIHLLHLPEEDGEISCDTYFRQPKIQSRAKRRWGVCPFQFTLVNGDGRAEKGYLSKHYDERVDFDPECWSSVQQDLLGKSTDMAVATLLLRQPAGAVTTAAVHGDLNPPQLNEQDVKEPAFGVKTVAVNRVRLMSHLRGLTFDRSAKAPHERRGHYRTLRSGRIVPVKSSKIHGGSDEASVYNVVRAAAQPGPEAEG